MTARKMKTAKEIDAALDDLAQDLFFSFGIPLLNENECLLPENDPSLNFIFENRSQEQWALSAANSLCDLRTHFREGRAPEWPKPKPPAGKKAERRSRGASPT